MSARDSDDYSTDGQDGKRKASTETMGYFARSKKTGRSPTKETPKNEDKIEQILIMMQDMCKDQKDMKKIQNQIKNEVHQIREEQKIYNEEMKKMKEENNLLKEENRIIKKELQEMKKIVEIIEKKNKMNNVVIHGLEIDSIETRDMKKIVCNFLKQSLNVDIKPKLVNKIGEKTCVIELEGEEDKMEIMKNKTKLKNYKQMKVFINEDLTKQEREKQKQIRQMARNEIEKGNVVKLGYSKLVINGQEWRWNRSTEKLEQNTTKN